MNFPNHTPRVYAWTGWKAMNAIKGGLPQYEDNGILYTVWFYDGPEVHFCAIWKGVVPDGIAAGGYDQTQNDADKSDFETNVKPTANATIEPRTPDGRVAVRHTAANKARNFSLVTFSFVPGDPSTLKNWKINPSGNKTFTNASDVTMTCYDAGGSVTTDPTQAVRTVCDFEPAYNYEAIGGWIDIPQGIIGGTTGLWFMGCIGVPDIPALYGGSAEFVRPTNLEAVYTSKIVSDGRASQYLTYSPTYHTNKIRWILEHPVSSTAYFQVYLETFIG